MALGRTGSEKKILGSYELVDELHPGIVGPLWLAREKDGGDVVLARRVFHEGLTNGTVLDELERAAGWATRLKHDGVVPVLGTGRDHAELCVWSVWHLGEPLRSLLRLAGITRRPIPSAVALRIACDVLEAVAYLHEQTRDGKPLLGALNPDNVHVGADGRTRLLEPAISAVAARAAAWCDDVKRAAYDAPERFDQGMPGPSSDVFSVGILLWEMLRNRPLFAGASFDVVKKRVKTAAIRSADAVKPPGGEPIAASVAAVVARALERPTDARFATCAEMQTALAEEVLATREEVAAFVQELAADVLARQERRARRARGEDVPPSRAPGPPPSAEPPTLEASATEEPAGEPAEEREAPDDGPELSTQRTLLGMQKMPAPASPVGDPPDEDARGEPAVAPPSEPAAEDESTPPTAAPRREAQAAAQRPEATGRRFGGVLAGGLGVLAIGSIILVISGRADDDPSEEVPAAPLTATASADPVQAPSARLDERAEPDSRQEPRPADSAPIAGSSSAAPPALGKQPPRAQPRAVPLRPKSQPKYTPGGI